MLATLMLVAMQAAAPAAPPPPAADKADRTIVHDIVIRRSGDAREQAKDGAHQHTDILMIRDGDGKAAHAHGDRRVRIVDLDRGKPGEKREIRILRSPGHERHLTMVSCDSGSKVEDETIGKDGKKTRVMICAKGEAGASRVEALERAAKRIAENQHLSEDVRTRVVSRLNEEISRLKATK